MIDYKVEHLIQLTQEVARARKKLARAEDNLKGQRWLVAFPKVSSTTWKDAYMWQVKGD